jgi:putative cardiolipin synthase
MNNRKPRSRAVLATGLAVLAAFLVAGCGRLPSLEGRVGSTALPPSPETRLARAIDPLAAQHPGLSGVYPLADGRGAFATRALLVEAAERSLDVQYYIWHDDISGTLLLDALRRASDRGVRVRLLVDDNGIAGLDPVLLALDAGPSFEVRLYNPFLQRQLRPLGYLTDFRRLNRRMHNKSLTADDVATVVGGRNVGDEYFAAATHVNFSDLDLIAVGPVVGEVSSVFDRYWNSASAYPIASIVDGTPGEAREFIGARLESLGGAAAIDEYVQALRASIVVTDLLQGRLPLEWAVTRVIADDPAKTLATGASRAESTMIPRLAEAIGQPAERLDIVSPYFVPASAGTRAFAELAGRGVEVRVLTNSLAATDVAAVHAGYAKRRKALLESGVTLHELKPDAATVAPDGDLLQRLGNSGASLHAKTFAVDGQRAFVGSFNFDPRSAALNTEMGFVVESPTLANAIHAAFEETVPAVAYEARLDREGRLEWVDAAAGPEQVLGLEPQTGVLQRGIVKVLSWLPIDWLL